MGVVNVTPDSFSDGGRYLDAACRGRARTGSSPRPAPRSSTSAASRPGPGAAPVDAAEELRRIAAGRPRAGRRHRRPGQHRHDEGGRGRGARSRRARRWSTTCSGGTADPDLLRGGRRRRRDAASSMHMRGTPRTMRRRGALRRRRARRRRRAARPGRPPRSLPASRADAILADPGIGFAKTAEHNLALLAALPELAARVEVPLLVGTSRKSFLGARPG